MQRLTLFLLVVLTAVAGCAGPVQPPPRPPEPTGCAAQPAVLHTFHLAPGLMLDTTPPAAGSAPGNGFEEAFVTNTMDVWTSAPLAEGLHVAGAITIEAWIDVRGPPTAPEPGTSGEGRLLVHQVGSDRAFLPGAAAVSRPLSDPPGLVHVNHTIEPAPGGFTFEAGDRVRLLLSALAMETADGPATVVHFGGDRPSQVRFMATCVPPAEWMIHRYIRQPVVVTANQGGPLGLPPAGCEDVVGQQACVSQVDLPFTLENGTERLRLFLRTQQADREPKGDMDLQLLDSAGTVLYEAGSPLVNETIVLWPANLAAMAPPGPYIARANLYGGAAYSGLFELALERHAGHEH